jgi:hypothetical protein
MYRLIILSLLILASCKNAPKVNPDNPNLFGEEFEANNVIDMSKVFEQLTTQDTVKAVVSGTVESVCKKKGCWMNLKSDLAGDKELFVKFKDYGFFMPLDCEGRSLVMNGMAFKEITTVEELRHYAEDEGLSQEEIDLITEPEEEYKFVADGVIMK